MLRRMSFTALFIALTVAVGLVLVVGGPPEARAQDNSENSQSTGICGRTQKVQDAILAKLPDVSACGEVTDSDLAGITGKLELSNMGVTSLTSGDFAGLSSLTELDFEDNALTSVPQDIFSGLTSLKRLYLTFNEVGTLPVDLFDSLTNLEVLHLYGNKLTALDKDIFDGLANLDSLIFSANKVTELPQDLFDGLTSLEALELSRNEVTELPEDLFDDLGKLRNLNLHDNKITALTAGVFDGLGQLEYLLMGENEIAGIPSGVFEDLGKLRVLLLDGSQISELPSGAFKGLDSLESVSLLRNPGAPFNVTAELESRGDGLAVVVTEGAPGPMTVQLGVTGGTLSHKLVTVASGSVDSGVITVTPDGEGAVTVTVSGTKFSGDSFNLEGITASNGDDLTLAAADLAETSNTPAAGAPTIRGTLIVGQVVEADTSGITDTNGIGSVAYSYQWIRSSGDTDSPIAGATKSTYKLGASDGNKSVKLRVSFIDGAGYFESLTSAAVSVRVGGL